MGGASEYIRIYKISVAGGEGLHHAAHSRGTAHRHFGLILLGITDDALGGEEHAGDAGSVLQSHTCHFGRVDDAGSAEVLVAVCACVVAVVALLVLHVVDDDAAFQACILDNLTQRLFDGALNDADTRGLVGVLALQSFECADGADVSNTATGDDTFFDGCAGGAEGIVHAVLLLLHLGLGGSTDIEDCDTAAEFSQTLLQLLLVVAGGGVADFVLNLVDAVLDELALAVTTDDGGVVLADGHLVGRTQHFDGSLLELQALLFADDNATGQDSDIFEHSLAAVAKARSFHGADLQLATQAVDNEGGEGFAIHVLSDDEQRTAGLYGGFEDGEEVLEVGDLLVVDEDVGVLHLALHLLGVGDEVCAEVAAVELHSFDDADGGVAAFGLFDGDDAVLGDFLHSLGQQLSDFRIVVSAYGSYLLDLVVVVAHLLALSGNALYDLADGFVDAALEIHGVCTCGDVLQTLADNSLSEYGSGGGAITCIVARLGGNALHELCTGILECIGKLNLLGNGHAVLGDLRSTEFLLNNYITTFRAQSYLYGICQLVHALLHLLAGFDIEFDFFCHDCRTHPQTSLMQGREAASAWKFIGSFF